MYKSVVQSQTSAHTGVRGTVDRGHASIQLDSAVPVAPDNSTKLDGDSKPKLAVPGNTFLASVPFTCTLQGSLCRVIADCSRSPSRVAEDEYYPGLVPGIRLPLLIALGSFVVMIMLSVAAAAAIPHRLKSTWRDAKRSIGLVAQAHQLRARMDQLSLTTLRYCNEEMAVQATNNASASLPNWNLNQVLPGTWEDGMDRFDQLGIGATAARAQQHIYENLNSLPGAAAPEMMWAAQ